MWHEDGFLHAIRANPADESTRLVYADWLDEQGDPRGDFIRLRHALSAAGPDHIDRVPAEHELSHLRAGCDPAWLAVIEPEAVPGDLALYRASCGCVNEGFARPKRPIPYLHTDAQDTECDAWKRLLDLVEQAATDGREEFAPLRELTAVERSQIRTLPASIAKLTAVKTLNLYGSVLVRIPPEIGGMTALDGFVPYTSYRLHWFPYEITRCRNLQGSTVSTRAIYGNYKYRPPFPRLDAGSETAPGRTEPGRLPLKRWPAAATRPCSVCDRPFEDQRLHRVWVSLRVATDVLPLLVNACSAECVRALPAPPDGYVPAPHRGGPGVQQPPRR